jgi:hypothetical protein
VSTSTTDLAGFGDCTQDDLDDLDDAVAEMRGAETERESTRATVARVMGVLLEKGALRARVAERAGVNPQTVSFMVNGRPPRSEVRARSGKGHK